MEEIVPESRLPLTICICCLTLLFDCDSVGVRLVPLSSAMCPSSCGQYSLVGEYIWAGTEWLPKESVVTPLVIALFSLGT